MAEPYAITTNKLLNGGLQMTSDVISQPRPADELAKWEYVFRFVSEFDVNWAGKLSEMGQQGWSLDKIVGFSLGSHEGFLLFKRSSSPPPQAMKRWEYAFRYVSEFDGNWGGKLSETGQQGWELDMIVGFTLGRHEGFLLLRRLVS